MLYSRPGTTSKGYAKTLPYALLQTFCFSPLTCRTWPTSNGLCKRRATAHARLPISIVRYLGLQGGVKKMFRAIIKALLAGRAFKKLSWKFEILFK